MWFDGFLLCTTLLYTTALLWVRPVFAQLRGQEQQQIIYSGNYSNNCVEACAAIADTLGEGHKVFYQPFTPSQLAYYSARQRLVRPLCLAVPHSPEDVSFILQTIGKHDCRFAAKSGGHSMFAGASSAPDGITIDLKMFNTLELSDDEKTLRVGPGNRWKDVYTYLERWNLTVIGGRSTEVGVGGLLLGGGISYVSRRHGWGVDNVRNFEVVLANGSISNINYITHPDLYWALRGGGAGFGIVTRFDLETYEQTASWGDFTGMLVSGVHSRALALGSMRTSKNIYARARHALMPWLGRAACMLGYCMTVDEYLERLWSTAEGIKDDSYSQFYAYITLLNWGEVGGFHITNSKGDLDATAFQGLKKGKKLLSTARTATIGGLADDLGKIATNGGKRTSYSTLTFRKPDFRLLKDIHDIFIEEANSFSSHDKTMFSLANNLLVGLTISIVSKDEIFHMGKNGGNPLGLQVKDAPLMMFVMTFLWPDEKDDELVYDTIKRILSRMTAIAKQRDQFHPFLYQNYAEHFQDVFAGYGEENRKRLRQIQKKYDPQDVFQRLQAGYFMV